MPRRWQKPKRKINECGVHQGLSWYDPAVGNVTRNCAVKKSLCGTERLSRSKGASDADDDDCGFSVAEAAADFAGVSSVDCSERWTALTARGGGDDASEELVITPEK